MKALVILLKSLARLFWVWCKCRYYKIGNGALEKTIKIQNLTGAMREKSQSKDLLVGGDFLDAVEELSDITIEQIRRAIENTEHGKIIMFTNPNRRLYAVLKPTRDENIQRIKNAINYLQETEKITVYVLYEVAGSFNA